MERPPEPPWTEHEKVYLLAEILKAAPVSSDYLLSIVRDWRLSPKWSEICLPFGRSMTSCQLAFQSLNQDNRPYQSSSTFATPPQALQSRVPTSDLPKKRPLAPETSALNTLGRIIQPRPPSAYSHEPIRSASPYNTSPRSAVGGVGPGQGVEPAQKKKRGRPTKAEAQARAEAAAARGDTYPPSRLPRPDARQLNPQVDSLGGPLQSSPIPMTPAGAFTPQHGTQASLTRPATTSESETEGSPKKPKISSSRSGTSGKPGMSSATDIGVLKVSTERSPGKPVHDPGSGGRVAASPGHQQLSPPLSSVTPSHPQPGKPPTSSALATEESEQRLRRQEEPETRQQQQAQQQPSQQEQQSGQQTQQRTTPHSFKETVGM